MTTTIDENQSVVTLINVFDVEPLKQDELVELLEKDAVEVMQYLEGFISSSVHRGLDGKHVANYVQWARRTDFEATLGHPKVQECQRIVNAVGRSTSALYRVDSVCNK